MKLNTRYSNLTLEEFCDLFESHVIAAEFAQSAFPIGLLNEAVQRFDEVLVRFEDVRRICCV